MIMRVILIVSLALLAAVCQADSNRFYGYVGGAVGKANSDYDYPDFRVEDDDVSYDFFGGFSFNRYVAVEGGINDSGSVSENFPGFEDELSISGQYLAAIGKYPVSDLVSVYGKLGIAFWEVEEVLRSSLGAARDDDSGTDPFFAAGLRYDLDEALAFTAEFRVLNVEPDLFGESAELDISTVAVGLIVGF